MTFRDPRNRVRLRRAARRAEKAQRAFHDTVREVAETETVRAIAEAVGLSPTRVHQIKHGKE